MRTYSVGKGRAATRIWGHLGIYGPDAKLAVAHPVPITARECVRQLQLASVPLQVL